MASNFQRVGSKSNTDVGKEFELVVKDFFLSKGISLEPDFEVFVGFRVKKPHKFDLGSETPPILVECKSYKWTSGGNSPSAKIMGLNEVMLLFSVSPEHYRKILFMLKDLRGNESLAAYYIRTRGHLIGPNVEIWEFDAEQNHGEQLY